MQRWVLGTLTIGQAPRPDVVPIIDRYIPADVRRIHIGVLDGQSRGEIDRRYRPEPEEPVLVTRLQDGTEVQLSRRRMKGGVRQASRALEAEGCDAIPLLCTGTFASYALSPSRPSPRRLLRAGARRREVRLGFARAIPIPAPQPPRSTGLRSTQETA